MITLSSIPETSAKPHTYNANTSEHLIRTRISALLSNAIKKPLVIICAGAGCGKTRAVLDFIEEQSIPTMWMQLSSRDNTGSRFWENHVNTVAQINKNLADEYAELGFPDTPDKVNQYFNLMYHGTVHKRRLHVLDDFHLLEDTEVLKLVERVICEMPKGRTMILICRDLPKINIVDLHARGLTAEIDADDLNFTESEIADYISAQGLSADRRTVHDIFSDTNGWAFSVNLIARSLRKSPGYTGYVRNAIRQNINNVMEKEVWETASDELKRFLVRLSLIDHISADLVDKLLEGDEALLCELRRQNAYIHFDSHTDAYLIHHLFLDFLQTKQDIITDGEKHKTYKAAADWCKQNGFKVDALGYYEKIGDYESIVSIFFALPLQIPRDIALHGIGIFERAPADTFKKVNFFASTHLRTVAGLARWQEFFSLMKSYESQLLELPSGNTLRESTLGVIYNLWGVVRIVMSTFDDKYDFHKYFIKWGGYLSRDFEALSRFDVFQRGAWISNVGSARQGAPQEFIEAMIRSEERPLCCYNGVTTGAEDLARGELLFYQGDIKAAQSFVCRALESARKRSQFENIHRALVYTMRIAVFQGNRAEAAEALDDIETLLNEKKYFLRFTTYDIAQGFFYYILRQPEMFPGWLKEKFAPYEHACFIENFGNQIKARFCYLTGNYHPLLAYIEELKKRESILYGRVEMLALEACVHYQMKDKTAAVNALLEAYETASPNDIITPFIELGKDMRTLAASAISDPDCGIPIDWLETIKRRSSSYAKYQSLLISDYKKGSAADSGALLTNREKEILSALYRGISRSEIASNLKLSINSINSFINNIYKKLDARSIVDVIRIAAERKLVS